MEEIVKIISAAIGLCGSVKPEKQAQAAYDALIKAGYRISQQTKESRIRQ